MATFALPITTTAQHDEAVELLYSFERNPASAPAESEIEALMDAVEAYADAAGLNFPAPKTVGTLLEVEMFSRDLSQRALAELLGVPETRLSEILRGKRGVNLDFAQRLHYILGVPADVALSLQANEDIPALRYNYHY